MPATVPQAPCSGSWGLAVAQRRRSPWCQHEQLRTVHLFGAFRAGQSICWSLHQGGRGGYDSSAQSARLTGRDQSYRCFLLLCLTSKEQGQLYRGGDCRCVQCVFLQGFPGPFLRDMSLHVHWRRLEETILLSWLISLSFWCLNRVKDTLCRSFSFVSVILTVCHPVECARGLLLPISRQRLRFLPLLPNSLVIWDSQGQDFARFRLRS